MFLVTRQVVLLFWQVEAVLVVRYDVDQLLAKLDLLEP